jgi:hypothetical protein
VRSLFVLFVAVAALGTCGTTSAGNLLNGLEPSDRQFEDFEIGGKIVYFHQRVFEGVLIERDYINYQFDRATGVLLSKKMHWREDLPEHLARPVLSREDAEAMVPGQVQRADLYLISPESYVYPVRPVPENPCWVVRTLDGDRIVITIIDSVTGRIVGNGVPPPYNAFSITGPGDCPPTWDWRYWSQNAAHWFNTMGYSAESVVYATLEQIRGNIKSDENAMFYEIDHGGSDSFRYGCDNGSWLSLQAFKVGFWIANFAKMPFTFLSSCDGMCDLGPGTFSYEFRKGSFENTATVGYCGMSTAGCADCWDWSVEWQDALFGYMSQGFSVKSAFDQANADYPVCGGYGCMRFAGDESFAVVPAVTRDPEAPTVVVISPNGGETIECGAQYDVRWTATDNARVTSVTLLLSTDGGVTYPDTIASGESNDSSFLWSVPDLSTHQARIRVVAFDGVPNEGLDASDADFTLWGTTAGVGPDLAGVPAEAVLSVQNGNPITSSSRVVYGVPFAMRVRVALYDVRGRMLAQPVDGTVSRGYRTMEWSSFVRRAPDLSSGIYFIRLDTDAGAKIAKVVLAR